MRSISICFLFIILYSCSGLEGKDGTNTTYYVGTKQIMKTVEYKNGKKNGYYTEYYRTGQISSKQFYVNDTIQDTSISFYENGKTAAITVYKKGKRNGTWK